MDSSAYLLIKTYGFNIFIIIATLLFVHFFNYLLKKAFIKYISKPGTVLHVFYNIIRFLMYVSAFVVILQVCGYNVSSIITGLGLMSAIVGLAFQDSLRDLFSGIGILYEHFFDIGDVVVLDNGMEGEVVGFTVKSTRIKDLDSQSITSINNRNITSAKVLTGQFDLDLSLYYEEDVDKVNEVLSDICSHLMELDHIDKAEYLHTSEFKESSVVYKIRYYGSAKYKYSMERAVLTYVWQRLKKENIHIAYNQLEINSRTSEVKR